MPMFILPPGVQIDYQALQNTAMTILRDRLANRQLSDEQQQEVTRLLSDTNEMITADTLKVLGVAATHGLSKPEMLAMVMEQKKKGDLSIIQSNKIEKLEIDNQVFIDKMEDKDLEYVLQVLVLHGLIEVLNLKPEDMGVDTVQLAEIEKKFKKLIWSKILT